MTKYLKIMRSLLEDEKKKTRTGTKSKAPPLDGFDPKFNNPVTKVPEPPPEAEAPPQPPPRPTPPDPNRRTGPWTPEMQARMDAMMNADIPDDEISDEEAFRRSGRGNTEEPQRIGTDTRGIEDNRWVDYEDEDVPMVIDTPGDDPEPPVDNRDLPAVMDTAIAETGSTIRINWTPIRHLPGYVVNRIRKVGREIFRDFTDVPLEEIVVVSEMSGSSETEVRSLFRWIKTHAQKVDEMTMDFHDMFGPGYNPEVQDWKAYGYTFRLVHEPTMGQYYVYCAPSKGNNDKIDDPDIQRLLRLR